MPLARLVRISNPILAQRMGVVNYESKGGPQGVKQPKNITVKRIYEPNMQAMVQALRTVIEYENREERKDVVRKTSA